ncbi:hypothetical protein F4805DRAFT_461680 [Annulohypoxylon moriforme]|nr:hypothetical protein F4805DRAFT_461680 [Annulohypoxylon moriforme]
MAVLTQQIRYAKVQMLARKRMTQTGYTTDVRLMAHLWLSRSPKAFIFEFTHNKETETIEFDETFRSFNAKTRKRSHPTSDPGSDSENPEDPGKNSKVDAWTEKDDIKKTIYLFHNILGQIKEHVEAQAKNGCTRLLVKQGRKTYHHLMVTEASHLTVKLVSQEIKDEIGKVTIDNPENSSHSDNSGSTESEGSEDDDDSPDMQGCGSGTNEGVQAKRRRLA